jgi:outer membrane protein, heavy metal efflux system
MAFARSHSINLEPNSAEFQRVRRSLLGSLHESTSVTINFSTSTAVSFGSFVLQDQHEEIPIFASRWRRKMVCLGPEMKWLPAIRIAIVSLVTGLLLTGCVRYKARPLSAPVIESQYRARSIDSDAIQKFVRTAGWSQWPPAILDLNALTLIAAYYSPDLDISRAQITIAEAAVRSASPRANPSLGADGGYSAQPEAHPIYSVAPGFTIETAGKRGDRILIAEKDAEVARLDFAEAQWFLWSRVRTALMDYILAERKLNLLQREAELRTEASELLEKRLSVGAAAQPEVDVYRVESLRAKALLDTAKGDAAQKLVALATAMGIPPEALANKDIEYRNLDAPPTNVSLTLHTIQKAGLLHRIDVRRTLVEYAAAEAALKLEIARQYPDIQLTPTYGFEEGFARYVFSSALSTLPVFNRYKGPIYSAEARRRQVEARFRALQAQAIGEMGSALNLYRSALQAWQTQSDQLAKVELEREEAARRALQAGQGDRLSLVLAEIETNTVALGQLNALVQVQTSLGLLEDSVQQPLESAVRTFSAPESPPRREVVH